MTQREEASFLSEVRERLSVTLSDRQEQLCLGAFDRKPSAVLVMLERALSANNPGAYFFSGCARMVDETPAPAKPKQQRHDMAEVACNDCGDSGFVILTHDVGPDALEGDAAPCHCATGHAKMRRLGVVDYTAEDYEPVVPAGEPISIVEYAQSEAGKNDPHLAAARESLMAWQRKGRPQNWR